jgi:putative tributyrin esterase
VALSFECRYRSADQIISTTNTMSWAEVHWESELIGKETTMQVLIPRVGTPPYSTLYLLHALNDDSYAWMRRTRVESLVRSLPLVIVMPDGYR